MFFKRQIIFFQHYLQMTLQDIGGVAAFIDNGLVRHDPYLIKGVDRNIGGVVFLPGTLIHLIPEFLA